MIPIQRLIRSRRKTIALIVERDGTLTVRAPLRLRDATIRQIIADREDWIRSKQAEYRLLEPQLPPKEYVEGESFWYLGQVHKLQLVDSPEPALSLNGTFRLSRPALPEARTVFERWYRKQARQIISARLERFAREHGYSYLGIRISSARTRWGSCSSRGTLSFTWRLVMAPREVIDYLVVHELVHLKIQNHSKAFWSRVEEILPDYRARRDWLKKNGHLLSLD